MRPMLFDLKTDPDELHDLGEDPQYQAQIKRLREVHFDWARQHHTRITRTPEIIEKMVTGRLKKFVAEVTLEGQPFVKDPDLSVAKLLAKEKAKVLSFIRYEVGEGVEKKLKVRWLILPKGGV